MKITQEIAEQRSIDVGVRLIGEYIKSSAKTMFECPFCQKEFSCSPKSIWAKSTKSCGCLGRGTHISQQEAVKRSVSVGIKMIGEYIDGKTKTAFECPFCQQVFLCAPHQIIAKTTRSCGCLKRLSHRTVEKRCMSIGIKMLGKYIDSNTKTEFECPICQQRFFCVPQSIWSGDTRSCGCLRKQSNILSLRKVEQKNTKLGTKMIGTYVNCHTQIEFECQYCKKNFMVTPSVIWTKPTMSCGCMNNNKTMSQEQAKQKSLDAGFVMVGTYINARTKIEFVCPECSSVFLVNPNTIWSGIQSRCGNCQRRINGVLTSKIAKKLDQLIQSIFPHLTTHHNHKIRCSGDKRATCVDIAIPISDVSYYGIAIEYDEYYWHAHKTEKDEQRLKKLNQNDWKTLHIKASKDIPTKKQLKKAILCLMGTTTYSKTITLPSWGTSPTRFPIPTNTDNKKENAEAPLTP